MKPDLELRLPKPSDAEGMVAAIQASIPELSPWLPFAKKDYGLDSAMGWIQGRFGDRYRRLMFEPGGKVVGAVAINNLDDLNRRGNLGYWVRTGFTGRGYATYAAAEMARFGIEEAELERIEILMGLDNEASRKVAERIGASLEGVARGRLRLHGIQHDCHQFSIVPADGQ